ncbi:MAG TPA: ABC-F family ATP-binding cassette domain-containing protein [Clostridiales bacterium]|nr:ABC-F family ATP-binding cassette domain-containing protein [Clostridiales bacterium]
MLQIRNLTLTHKKDLRVLIKDLSFNLNKGDKAAIIGEEGNGKSTLLKLIYDAKLVEGYIEYTGDIIKNNLKLGYLAQELPQDDNAKTVYEFCSNNPHFFDITPKELANIAYWLGLPCDIFYSDQIVGTLSGGEKVKLQFSSILMNNPDILLLDEPSNDIDINTLEWLERFINSCEQPVLFVSHDETLLERTANTIIHLELVRRKTMPRHTVAQMGYRDYVEQRQSKLEHQEQIARKERSEFEKKMEKYRRIFQQVEHEQNTISRSNPSGGRLLKKKMKSVKSLGRRLEKEKENITQIPDVEEEIMLKFNEGIFIPNGKTVLELEIDKLQMGERILANNISLNITGPEKVCIVGENGSGKTTLLKLIADMLLARKDINAAYMPQNYEEMLNLSKTPVEFLAPSGDKGDITRVRTLLGSVKYTADEMEHPISELSGGQKAKLLFIKMILQNSNVLILDEPTRNFSPLSNPVIRDILRSFKGCIISVSHDRKYITQVCSKIYELTENGLLETRVKV